MESMGPCDVPSPKVMRATASPPGSRGFLSDGNAGAREQAAGVLLENIAAVLIGEGFDGIDQRLDVVEALAGGGVRSRPGTRIFRAKQDVRAANQAEQH